MLALYGPTWLEAVPAILPLALAAATAMTFHYIPLAVTAIGRPYLSAAPVMVTLLARIAFGVLLYDGSLDGFAWALCLATLVTTPVIAFQQSRCLGLGTLSLLRALVPSAIVAVGCALAGAALMALMPAALSPLTRLLLLGPVLAAIWYLLLRLTHHELVGEVHRLAAPIKTRLALLRADTSDAPRVASLYLESLCTSMRPKPF